MNKTCVFTEFVQGRDAIPERLFVECINNVCTQQRLKLKKKGVWPFLG